MNTNLKGNIVHHLELLYSKSFNPRYFNKIKRGRLKILGVQKVLKHLIFFECIEIPILYTHSPMSGCVHFNLMRHNFIFTQLRLNKINWYQSHTTPFVQYYHSPVSLFKGNSQMFQTADPLWTRDPIVG